MNWEIISTISTLVGTVVVVATAISALVQINEMKRVRKFELMVKIFDELTSKEAREQRVYVYSRPYDDPEKITSKDVVFMDAVLAKMDLMWLLIDEKQLDDRYLFDAYGELFIRLWDKLHPMVLYERTRRGDYYRKKSENLVNKTKAYFRRKGRDTNYPVYKSLTKRRNNRHALKSRK